LAKHPWSPRLLQLTTRPWYSQGLSFSDFGRLGVVLKVSFIIDELGRSPTNHLAIDVGNDGLALRVS
jgi:hypothetical protein